MSEYKKQHYVPVFYMKNFSSNGKTVSVFHMDEQVLISNSSIKSQCQEKFFYGNDLEIEHQYQKYEIKWSNAIRRVIEEEPLTEETLDALKSFALYQRCRTKTTLDYRKEQSKQATIEFIKSIALSQGIDPDKHKPLIERMAEEKASELSTPKDIIEVARESLPYIKDLRVLVVDYQTRERLISSDTPVIMTNPIFGFRGNGLGLIGLVMFYPVNPSKLVVVYDSLSYSVQDIKDGVFISNDDNEVKTLNAYQYVSANNILFSNDPNDLKSYLPDAVDARERTKKQSVVSALGDGEQKLVAIHERDIMYYGNLSFCREPRSFKRVPKECKEPLPRYCDAETERVLLTKRDAVIKMGDALKKEGFFGKLSKKEYKRGSKEFFRQAQIYWAKHRLYYKNEEELLCKIKENEKRIEQSPDS